MNEFLQPNLTDLETVNLIKKNIVEETPFALTRYGDGEIYILKKKSYPQFEKRACNEWGYKYPEEVQYLYMDGSKIIADSLISSDVIGIMKRDCDIVKINYSEDTWSIEKNLLESIGVNIKNLQICDHQISRQKILGSVSGMSEILQGRSVTIISTNTELLEKKNLENLLKCEVSLVHHSHNINLRNRQDFIENFDKIKSKVVLLGVGLQKDYTTILKNTHGKIAIDMGATMDAWAGIYSRPWFKKGGLQEHLIID